MDEMNSHDINCIQCKNRCVSRTEEREINQWGDSEHMKINYDYPNFSDTVTEKNQVMQCLHHTSIFGFSKTLLIIENVSVIILKEFWIIYPEGTKIDHLSTLK